MRQVTLTACRSAGFLRPVLDRLDRAPEPAQDGLRTAADREGGRFAGDGFYLLKGKPVFTWNLVDLQRMKWEDPEALVPGNHTLE